MAGTPRLAGLLLVFLFAAIWAPPAGVRASAPSRGVTAQVREIASRLRCPVCQNESVADSPSELAAQMRALIRTKLEEGQSPDAIVAYFVSRYGEWILLDPPRKGWGWILWTVPAALVLIGLTAVIVFVRRTVRRGIAEAPLEPFDRP